MQKASIMVEMTIGISLAHDVLLFHRDHGELDFDFKNNHQIFTFSMVKLLLFNALFLGLGGTVIRSL